MRAVLRPFAINDRSLAALAGSAVTNDLASARPRAERECGDLGSGTTGRDQHVLQRPALTGREDPDVRGGGTLSRAADERGPELGVRGRSGGQGDRRPGRAVPGCRSGELPELRIEQRDPGEPGEP